MTQIDDKPEFDEQKKQQSLLPFDDRDMLSIRVLPSEFSRMIGVSKQTVSRWISSSKITLGADGRVDPNAAMRQVLKNCEPGRVRARLVRQAYSDMADLRSQSAKLVEVEEELAAALRRVQYLEGFAKETDLGNEFFMDILLDAADKIRAQPDRESLRKLLDALSDEASIKAGVALGNIDADERFSDLDIDTRFADFDVDAGGL